jgi:hypothetical protein
VTFRFKVGMKYEGETWFGGCGYVNRNMVTILKRTKNYITYQEKFGRVVRVRNKYHVKCEYFSTSFEDFYADSVEPTSLTEITSTPIDPQ